QARRTLLDRARPLDAAAIAFAGGKPAELVDEAIAQRDRRRLAGERPFAAIVDELAGLELAKGLEPAQRVDDEILGRRRDDLDVVGRNLGEQAGEIVARPLGRHVAAE